MPRVDPFDVGPRRSTRKSVPFPFVLDELAPLDPQTRPMFGCLGVYVGERIVLILRDKGPSDADSGVWVAFNPDSLDELLSELPRLGEIEIFRTKVAGWKKLSARSIEFEDDVQRVCAMILRGDERVGKVPGAKRTKVAVKTAVKPKSPKAATKAASKAAPKKAAAKVVARKASRATATKVPAKAAQKAPAKAASRSAPKAAKKAAKKASAKKRR
jgi:hypothetical protein